MHWTERGRAVVRIGEELRNRGWTLFGYQEDQSDMRTDYYSPASWSGVATHPELSGTVACVDVGERTYHNDDWPTFQATPSRKTWHVERDGEIIYAGVGLAGCSWSSERWHDKVRQVVDHIERVAYGPVRVTSESSSVTATDDYTVTVEHDNDWTWLFFDAKPSQTVRDRLKGMGARWGRKRQGWYFKRNVMDAELAWLTGDDNDGKEEDVVPPVPVEPTRHSLVLDDEGMDADPVTGYEPGRGDAFDYIPEWMTVPGSKETEGQGVPLALIKLFTPDSDWTWYVIEYDPQIKEAFGLVVRSDWTMTELGYFSLSEMETVTGPLGLRIERDLWFTPKPITDVDGYKTKWENGGPYRFQPVEEKKPDRPEPKFDIGDTVHFTWTTEPDTERRSVCRRDWREYEGKWHYKVSGKFWGEDGLVMAAEAETEPPEPPESVQVSEKLPTGWTIEDIAFLLEKLEDGPILTATGEFGIPSIHDFPAQAKHLGFGLFEVKTAECTFQYDGGTQMHRTPSGHESWTRLRAIEGEYDYPFDEIRANLEGYLNAAKDQITNADNPVPDEVLADYPNLMSGEPILPVGELVWWEKDGNVLTGVVDYVASDGDVVVKCNDHLAVADGVPIGRIEHVELDLLHKGEPPKVLTKDEAVVQEAVIVPDDKSDEEDGIPDFIEVDLGPKYGWATATVARLRGKWLYYHLTQEHCHKPDTRGGKVQIIGRDILWRSTAAPASQRGVQ